MSDVKPYPLSFDPIFKSNVWGGRGLATSLGKALPGNGPVGESWEMVDLPEDQSVVAAGPAQGIVLDEILGHWGKDLLGSAALDGGRFPLLVKYIDACQTLSVQVHPDAEVAARLGGRPKSEAWYIMDVAPGGAIYLGLQPGVTREMMQQAMADGGVEELLIKVEVKPGDLVPVPPGTVHAIGAGVLLAEVQQPSDTTYRVYDWGRMGLDGKPRQLHLDQALDSIHFGEDPPPMVREGEMGNTGTVNMDLFQIVISRLFAGGGMFSEDLVYQGPGPVVVVGLEGEACLEVEHHEPLWCGRGDVALIPHCCRPLRVTSREEWARVMLVTFPPGAAGSRGAGGRSHRLR